MKKFILCLSFAWLVLSCASNKVDYDGQVLEIDNFDKNVFEWSTQIDIKKVIPLEATDCSLLGIARKCLVKNNRVLFLDYKPKAINVFDLEGRFLYRIDSVGGGSQEYTELKDAIFNYDGTQLMVLDYAAILVFDANDGSFVKRIDFDAGVFSKFDRFINLGDDLFYFFAATGEYTIYQYSNQKFVGVKKSKGYQLVYERFQSQQGNSCLLAPDYGLFDIAKLDKEGITPSYYIDFGNKAMPEAMLPQNISEFDRVEKESYFKCLVDVKETNQGILLQVVNQESSYYIIYMDKASGKISTGIPDKATRLVVADVSPVSFYGLIYPDYFSEESGLYDDLKAYISDDGNPFLIEFSMK